MEYKFKSIKDLIAFMNAQSKRIWVSCDDPMTRTLGFVDEHLEFNLGIKLTDFKMSADLITADERVALLKKEVWRLVEGCELTDQQRKLLSPDHYNKVSSFLQGQYKIILSDSLLRTKGKLVLLPSGDLPVYDFNPKREICFFNEKLEIESRECARCSLPLFELSYTYYKKCDNIWDIEINKDTFDMPLLPKENFLYTQLAKKIDMDRSHISLIERMPLTVLFFADWGENRVGLSVFEQIGVGLF